MADERILTAPTVEQNVNITISGEEKLHDFASTLNDLAENKALNKYWKTQEELIKDVTNACEIYSKNIDNKKNATELLKFANALKAVSGTDLSTLLPNFKDISRYIEQATLKVGSLDKAFSVQNFQKTFESFKTMQAYSLDLDRMFKHFEIKPDVTELENNLKESQNQVTRLTEKVERLYDRLERAESGSGIDVLRDKCADLEYRLDEINENAQNIFRSFLKLNSLDSDNFEGITESYISDIKNGYLTAEQAIANFKREYSYLFDNVNFDSSQLKDFASTLNKVSQTVSVISDKLENLELGSYSSGTDNPIVNQASFDIESLTDILNSIDFQGNSEDAREMYVALANVLTILKEFAQIDEDNLNSVYGILRNLAKLDDLKINKTSLDNLANCLERIASINNTNSFVNLSQLDLNRFNDLHITKASLANLAEYLPRIANVNIEILERLSKVDFNNFSELKSNKDALENLKTFASLLREAFNGSTDEETNGLEQVNESAMAASKAKNAFVDSNTNVQQSIDNSVPKLQAEADAMQQIADSANAAANAKKKFSKIDIDSNVSNSRNSNSSRKNSDTETTSSTKNKSNTNVDSNSNVSNTNRKRNSIIDSAEQIIKQQGRYGTDNTVSVTIKDTEGLLRLLTYSAKRDEQHNVVYDHFGNVEYKDEIAVTEIANYKELSKQILDADETLRKLRSTKKDILEFDQNASTTAIDARIKKQKEYIRLLTDTYKVLVANDEYLLSASDLSQLNRDRVDARNKYVSDQAIKQEKKDAQTSNKELNKQNQKDHIEQQALAYNKLMDTIHKYERVKKQIANGEISKEDGNKKLLDLKVDINRLQKDPLLSKKQIQSSERELQRVDERIIDINKNIENKNASKELAERRKQIRDTIKDIDNLKKAATELNNAKATNEKQGNLGRYVDEKEQELKSAKEKAKTAYDFLNYIDMDGLSATELSEITQSLDKFKTAAQGSAKSVDNLNNALNITKRQELTELDRFIKSADTYYKNNNNRPNINNQSDLYKQELSNFERALTELKELKEKSFRQGFIDPEDINRIKTLKDQIDDLTHKLKTMYSADKGSDSLQRSKLKDTIAEYMKLNSNIPKHFKNELQRLINELDFGGPNVNVKELRDEFLSLKNAIRSAGLEGKSFLDVVKDKAWYGLAATLGTYFGLNDVINLIQEGARNVVELNSEIVDLAKVSEQTTKQIYENFSDYSTIAKDIGATISDTIDATAAWSKNGYNIPDAQDLAEVALIYKNVGDNIDIGAANDSLISTLRGFKMEASEAMKIVDVFNEVSNNEAITSSGIGEALQRSAASFEVAGTSLEKAVALITATNSVIQNPDKVGNMWKVVSARIRGAKTELLEMGEETEGMVESTSKLRALVKGITGFDIMEDENTFKDIYEIVLGIGKAWDDVNDIDKAALLEALAGKQQSNSLAAALSNTGILEKSYKEAMQSAGSAMREQEKYQESIQYSIDRAKASLEELSNTTINSESLKDFIDFGNGVIQVLNQMIEKFGLMPGVVAAATAFLGRGKLEQQFCPVWG